MAICLDEVFRQTAGRQADAPAVIGPESGQVLSYGALDECIREVADELRRAGVQRGDCIGLHWPSGADYIIFSYAIWRCGGCVVPLAVELTVPEKQEICRKISLDFVITSERQTDFVQSLARSGARPLLRAAALVPLQIACEHPVGLERVPCAFIRFTSGTTGASKGVVLSHQSVYERIQAANDALGIGPRDRIVWLLSMSYHFTVSIVSYLSFGAAILLPRSYFARDVLQAASDHQATLIYGSPMHYRLMAAAPGDCPLASLRLAISTTASLDRATAEAFGRRFGIPLSQALGIIEIGLPCINVEFAADRCEAVGHVLPAYEMRLEDVGLGARMQGVLFRGPGMLDAYYNPWQPREQILTEGWFRTGDVGEVDAGGCLYLRGRSQDVINVMGMKFFPQEVEMVLQSHPAVAAACVFARTHQQMGEIPHAEVVVNPAAAVHPTRSELMEYCKTRLASFKMPADIEFVPALRRTASGKLLHRA